jgi:hypothetical protein
MERITQDELHERLKAQGVASGMDYAFVCVVCGTVQSARLLVRAAGEGKALRDVERFLGFSCVGRLTGAGEHREGEPPGRGCNWSLGGLLHIHELEVELPGGGFSPCFRPATPEQAQELARSL